MSAGKPCLPQAAGEKLARAPAAFSQFECFPAGVAWTPWALITRSYGTGDEIGASSNTYTTPMITGLHWRPA